MSNSWPSRRCHRTRSNRQLVARQATFRQEAYPRALAQRKQTRKRVTSIMLRYRPPSPSNQHLLTRHPRIWTLPTPPKPKRPLFAKAPRACGSALIRTFSNLIRISPETTTIIKSSSSHSRISQLWATIIAALYSRCSKFWHQASLVGALSPTGPWSL